MDDHGPQFETVGTVARRAEVSPETVRRLIDAGKIEAIKTVGGVRLIERRVAEAFAQERAERRGR